MASSLHFVRRMRLPGAILAFIELVAIWTPVEVFFHLDQSQRQLLLRAAPIVLGAAQFVWWASMRTWRTPIVRAAKLHARGEILDDKMRESAYQAMLSLPRNSVTLRVSLWFISAAILSGVLHLRSNFSLKEAWTLTSITTAHAFGMGIFRGLWYARSLDKLTLALLPEIPPLRRFADSYRQRVTLAAFTTGVVGILAIAVFIYFFVPISSEQYLQVVSYIPLTIVALCIGWYAYVRVVPRAIDRYLDAELSPDPSHHPSDDDPRAAEAYRAGQMVPYKLALAKAGFWLLGELLLVAQSVMVFSIDRENAALMGGEAVVVTIGATLYEALWSRAIMRPLLSHISARHRPAPNTIRTPLRLRSKMLTNFGALTVFACGLSLFWSFMQYKVLATGFIQRESELRLESVIADLQVRAGASALRREDITAVLQTKASQFAPPKSVHDQAVFYFLPTDSEQAIAVGSGHELPPRLPEVEGRDLMRRRDSGEMELSDLHLTGSYARLVLNGQPLGSIAVLLPGYRGRGPSTVPQIQILICFFLVLLAASMGIVFLAANDLTRPVRELERRVAAMAAGDMSLPIDSSGEADEVGQLTFTFEEMRRALNKKLQSSAEMNQLLEQQVSIRTSELERRNRELNDALESVARTQDQLVRSEKMASMGRLVAGIAHEINNPVNAVVNTVGPLEKIISSLTATAPASAIEDVKEIGEMVRVIQGGARRTKEIVQALHNYSRGDEDRQIEVDLQRGIDDSLDLLRHQLKNGIKVERDYKISARVLGHAGQLNQVFLNLLTNAAQALSDKPNGGTIRIATATENNRAVVTVSDNGSGISPEVLPRIFDPFFTTKEVGKGSGLGLSIVHGIIERHGGTIDVQSEVGKGTTFTVSLPLNAAS